MYDAKVMIGLMDEALRQCDRAIAEARAAEAPAVVIEDLKHVRDKLVRYQSSMRNGVLIGGKGSGIGLTRFLDEISAPDYLFDAGALAEGYFQTGKITHP